MEDHPPRYDIVGSQGHAQRLPASALPPDGHMVDGWIVTAPRWYPRWSQYFLAVADLSRVEAPTLQAEGMTHEVLVAALDPRRGPYTVADVVPGSPLPHLEPLNVVEQVRTTGDQVLLLAEALVRAVVSGALNPETADNGYRVRKEWSDAVSALLLMPLG